MHLADGALQLIVEETDARDTNVICHKSASVGGDLRLDLWCAGSVARRPGDVVRLLQSFGEGHLYINPDTQEWDHERQP